MLLVYRFFLEDLRAMDGDCKHFYPVMVARPNESNK